MRRVSDLVVLILQILIGYLLVHFAHPISGLLSVRITTIVLFLAGGTIGFKALLDIGPSFSIAPAPHPKSDLVIKGIYSKIRHPMYLAVMLVCSGVLIIGFNMKSLIIYLIIIVFFTTKTSYEERTLLARYPSYGKYSTSTGRFLPRLNTRHKKPKNRE